MILMLVYEIHCRVVPLVSLYISSSKARHGSLGIILIETASRRFQTSFLIPRHTDHLHPALLEQPDSLTLHVIRRLLHSLKNGRTPRLHVRLQGKETTYNVYPLQRRSQDRIRATPQPTRPS
jgi:hypothetical protein